STPARCTNSHVADRKPFLLRIDGDAIDALQRWAADELRSLNGQIEFLLRDALRRAGQAGEARQAGPALSASEHPLGSDRTARSPASHARQGSGTPVSWRWLP